MKTKILIFVGLCFFMNCANDDAFPSNNTTIYSDKNIRIDFIDISDGRCPVDLNCFWAGNATVNLRIKNRFTTKDFTLNTHGGKDFPKQINILNHNVELIDVLPYPEKDNTYNYDDYIIKINVTKN